MTTAKRARRSKRSEPSTAASLIAALKFISIAQKKAGTVEQQFCIASGNWVAASNGIITTACPIEEDLNACPHTTQLLDALLKCGEELNITQLSQSTLSVKSGAFKAIIPCVDFAELCISGPDQLIAAIDDRVKEAFKCVLPLATEGAQRAHFAGVLLQAGSAVATNGEAILEYWHGLDLPPGLLIPKASAAAIAKTDKPLSGFGFSQSSVTFYFEDGSFIKTQLFSERYPNYQLIFPADCNPWPLPEGFFTAVHAIQNFSKNGVVYFDENAVSSHELEAEASTYKVEGLPQGMAFNSKYLTMLEHCFEKAEFRKHEKKVVFFGENVRGVLMGVDIQSQVEYKPFVNNETEDDIPF